MQGTEMDVAILGSGPAGLQAAIHAVRKKARVLVLGRIQNSSLARAHVENFCCMDALAQGPLILEKGREQARKAGAAFLEQDALSVEKTSQGFLVTPESGDRILARAVVLAMGVSRERLNLPGERELLGRGVSTCADCDGPFFAGQAVAVVGNGSHAADTCLTMGLLASEVHWVHGEVTVSPDLYEKVLATSVTDHPGRRAVEIRGKEGVTGLVLDDGSELAVQGVFVALSAKGLTGIAAPLGVDLDPETLRYVKTDKKQATSVPGVFAAGDICGPPWQVAKSVGEGCVAGLSAAAFARHAAMMGEAGQGQGGPREKVPEDVVS